MPIVLPPSFISTLPPNPSVHYSLPPLESLIFLPPLFLQCSLLLGPQTPLKRLIRLFLLPINVYLAWRSAVDHQFEPLQAFVHVNFASGIAGPYGIMKALEWGLVEGPYFWIGVDGQKRTRGRGAGRIESGDGVVVKENGDMKVGKEVGKDVSGREVTKELGLFERIRWTFYLFNSMRGIGWNWGCRPDALPAPFPRAPFHYFLRLLLDIVIYHIIFLISSSPVCLAQSSGSMSQALLELGIQRFPGFDLTSDLILTIGLGSSAWAGIHLGFQLLALLSFITTQTLRLVLPDPFRPEAWDSRLWPPLFENPWLMTSCRDFWSRCWHSLFRRCFVCVGFHPGMKVGRFLGGRGKVGRNVGFAVGVVGVYVVSGLMHEMGLWTSTTFKQDPTPNFSTTLFFVVHGLAVVAEYLFFEVTGRKVGGIFGKVWAFTFLIGTGTFLVKDWMGRGLGMGMIDPRSWYKWHYVVPLAPFFPPGIFDHELGITLV